MYFFLGGGVVTFGFPLAASENNLSCYFWGLLLPRSCYFWNSTVFKID